MTDVEESQALSSEHIGECWRKMNAFYANLEAETRRNALLGPFGSTAELDRPLTVIDTRCVKQRQMFAPVTSTFIAPVPSISDMEDFALVRSEANNESHGADHTKSRAAQPGYNLPAESFAQHLVLEDTNGSQGVDQNPSPAIPDDSTRDFDAFREYLRHNKIMEDFTTLPEGRRKDDLLRDLMCGPSMDSACATNKFNESKCLILVEKDENAGSVSQLLIEGLGQPTNVLDKPFHAGMPKSKRKTMERRWRTTGACHWLVCTRKLPQNLRVTNFKHVVFFDVPKRYGKEYFDLVQRTMEIGQGGHVLNLIGGADGDFLQGKRERVNFPMLDS